jgi:tRNA(fMet)-specific endonuclease VapC
MLEIVGSGGNGVIWHAAGAAAAALDAVLGALEVLPFEPPADTSYGLLRTRLEQAGTPIGANDLLNNDLLNNDLLNNDLMIAAQALSLGYVIVTDNEREFSRVKGLRLQNWLRSTE